MKRRISLLGVVARTTAVATTLLALLKDGMSLGQMLDRLSNLGCGVLDAVLGLVGHGSDHGGQEEDSSGNGRELHVGG